MELYEKVLGTVVGQAVGDALGFPFEGWARDKIAPFLNALCKGFVKHPCGSFPVGQYTDDTQMMRAIFSSMVLNNTLDGEDVAERFKELWSKQEIVGQGMACKEAVLKLINKETTWMDSGVEPGKAGNGAAMRAAPIGIYNYDTVEDLTWNAIMISRITHKDSRACAGAVLIASVVAHNLNNDSCKVGTIVKKLIQLVTPLSEEFAKYIVELPALIDMDDETAIAKIAGMGLENPETDQPPKIITPFVVPSVMTALWSFLKTPNNFTDCVTRAVSVGGDVDTTAAMTGALCGSLNGIQAIPAQLAAGINDRQKFGFNYFETLSKQFVENKSKKS